MKTSRAWQAGGQRPYRNGLLPLGMASMLCLSVAPIAAPAGLALAEPPHGPAQARSQRRATLQRTQLSLPFAGTWVVGQGYQGGETHQGYATYALDLVKLNAALSAYVRRGRRTRDWFGFGADLLATADGVVVRAIDRFPDNRVMGRSRDANTVIVRHQEAEYSEYVHLRHGSLRVRVGEKVVRGQVLARCGNSGAETPHLHWAFLSSIDPIRTRPAVFSAYQVQGDDGTWKSVSGTPRSGDVLRPVP